MKNKSDINDVADVYGFHCSTILHYLLYTAFDQVFVFIQWKRRDSNIQFFDWQPPCHSNLIAICDAFNYTNIALTRSPASKEKIPYGNNCIEQRDMDHHYHCASGEPSFAGRGAKK
jgi:hypothetical protein